MRFKSPYICVSCSFVSKHFTNIIPFSRSNQHDIAHKTDEDSDPATTTAGNNFYFCIVK